MVTGNLTTSISTPADRSIDRLFRPKKQGGITDSRSYQVFRVINALAIIAICFVTLYPFLNVVAVAFSSQATSTPARSASSRAASTRRRSCRS